MEPPVCKAIRWTRHGEIFVESGTSTYKVVGVPDDGTYDVTFKGYVDGTVRGTTTATVTVATPFIEITNTTALLRHHLHIRL